MSRSKAKDVPQLVEKYRQAYPDLDRDLLRKLIRLENPQLFSKKENERYSSNLKKLDRYQRKSFKKVQPVAAEKAKQSAEQTEREKAEPSTRSTEKDRLFSSAVQALVGYNEPVYLRRLPDNTRPIYVPSNNSRRLSNKIPDPDEILADQ